jgi:predicted metal-binding protein
VNGLSLRIEEIAAESRFTECGYIPIARLNYSSEVRKICEGNSCRCYGTSWACPPAVGTLEECRERIEQYDAMLLFTKKYELESSFDFEGMGEALRDFKKAVDRFHRRLDPVLSSFMLLSNEGCGRCAECTYPDAPCRFPDLLHHSLEGYGFVVNELAKQANVRYNNGPNTVTFFGALLFNANKE